MITNVYEATDKIVRILKKYGYEVKRVKKTNFDRHRIMEIIKKKPAFYGYRIEKHQIYVVYQREPLRKFTKIYSYEEETDGVGINLEILSSIVEAGIDIIIFVLGDGRIYIGNPSTILSDAKENGWIRKSKKTGETIVNYPTSELNILI